MSRLECPITPPLSITIAKRRRYRPDRREGGGCAAARSHVRGTWRPSNGGLIMASTFPHHTLEPVPRTDFEVAPLARHRTRIEGTRRTRAADGLETAAPLRVVAIYKIEDVERLEIDGQIATPGKFDCLRDVDVNVFVSNPLGPIDAEVGEVASAAAGRGRRNVAQDAAIGWPRRQGDECGSPDIEWQPDGAATDKPPPVSYTHLRAHET